MIGLKVITIFLISIVCYTSTEERQPDAKDRIDNFLKPPDSTILQKSYPYIKKPVNHNPSFLSKLVSWFNPFSSDSTNEQDLSSQEVRRVPQEIRHVPQEVRHAPHEVHRIPDGVRHAPHEVRHAPHEVRYIPQEGHHIPLQYLPPPPQISQSHRQEACNPCNKEPWIPVASTYGKETIIGFVNPSDLRHQSPHFNKGGSVSSLEFLHPPVLPVSQNSQYVAPNHPNQNYDLKPPTKYGPPTPFQEYGLPNQHSLTPPTQYGPPKPFQEYGPPNQHNVQLPDNHIASFSQSEHGNLQAYGLPNVAYGPSKQISHLPLPQQVEFNVVGSSGRDHSSTSNNGYDLSLENLRPPPKTQDQFGVSNQIDANYLPSTNYRYLSPPPNDNFIRPPSNYPHNQFNHQNKLIAPRFKPKQNIKISNKHKPPPHIRPLFDMRSPPDVRPPSDMKPPPINGFITNYGSLPPAIANNNPPALATNEPFFLPPLSVQTLPSVLPSDSYGVAVTGSDADYGLSVSTSGNKYLPPFDVLPFEPNGSKNIQISQSVQLPVFDKVLLPRNPIALPNLSQYPLAPIHNAQQFRSNSENKEIFQPTPVVIQDNITTSSSHLQFSSHQQHLSNQNIQNIQIIPSVPVVSFLSTVEHPINLIQSPLLELTTSNFSENSDDAYKTEAVKLNENPIVVQHNGDNEASATAQNVTYQVGDNKSDNENWTSDITVVTEKLAANAELFNNYIFESNNSISISPTFKIQTDLGPNPTEFTAPTLDYSNWSAASHTISTSMLPPPIGEESVWISTANGVGEQITTSTNKPKRIQIIIPYTTKNKPSPFEESFTKLPDLIGTQGRKSPNYSGSHDFEPKLSLYTQPPSSDSVWLQHVSDYNTAESKDIPSKTYTDTTRGIINIKDLLKMELDKKYYGDLPYDIITLQKNIDGWTEQEYSQKINRGLDGYQKSSTTGQLIPSKKIPDTYLTTDSINATAVTTPKYSDEFYDHEPAGSNSKESKFKDFETNFIAELTTMPSTSDAVTTETTELPSSTKSIWDTKQVTLSKSNQEKVYVVTPQTVSTGSTTPSTVAFSHPPKIGARNVITGTPSIAFSSPALGISLKPGQSLRSDLDDNVRIIFSEWPHLINKLVTTTTEKTSTRHPLFGLMDLSSYVPPVNTSIQTYSGHSKVITIVTPVSVSKEDET